MKPTPKAQHLNYLVKSTLGYNFISAHLDLEIFAPSSWLCQTEWRLPVKSTFQVLLQILYQRILENLGFGWVISTYQGSWFGATPVFLLEGLFIWDHVTLK